MVHRSRARPNVVHRVNLTYYGKRKLASLCVAQRFPIFLGLHALPVDALLRRIGPLDLLCTVGPVLGPLAAAQDVDVTGGVGAVSGPGTALDVFARVVLLTEELPAVLVD